MSNFEIIEFIVFLAASILYIRHLIQDPDFIPNPIGFGIWMIADAIHIFTYLDFSSFWVGPVIMLLGAVITVIIGVIRTIKNWKRREKSIFNWLDYTVIGTVVVSIAILLFSHNSVWSNMAIQVTLTLGFVPIIKNIIMNKTQEPILPWSLFFIGFSIVLIHTFKEYNQWEELIYPIVCVIGDLVILILILINTGRNIIKEMTT